MAGKWKRKLKKIAKVAGKAALIGGALYGATRLGRKKPTVSGVGQDAEDINIGTRAGIFPPRKRKFVHPPYDASEDKSTYFSKGGRIGAKHGGKVKSMGVAKRGGGVAIK